MKMQSENPPWFAEWFNSDLYTRVYKHRCDAEAHTTVQLMLQVLDLPAGSRVLDLACGNGRHTLALHEAGLDAAGLDLSPTLLQQARERLPADVPLFNQDMRDPIPDGPWDAVGNFFTSFGYFDDREQDVQVLRRVHDALLERRGHFFFDYLNAEHTRSNLVPQEESTVEDLVIRQERRADARHVHKKISIRQGEHEHSFEERVRLYTLDDFRDMFAAAGLSIRNVYGDYRGADFGPESPRLILVAQAE